MNFLIGTLLVLYVSAAGADANHSVQFGFEYDSNVFKTFQKSRGDSLVRSLFKSQGRFAPAEKWELGWNFQLGGKKYFDNEAKDVLIQYIEFPISWTSAEGTRVLFNSDFKYQNEDNTVQPLDSSLPADVNEDFFSPSARLQVLIPLPQNFSFDPFGQYTYFRFQPNESFGYHLERGGASIRNRLSQSVLASSTYTYQRQQFLAGSREDTENEISGALQFSSTYISSFHYTYQTSDSTDSRFSYHNHRVTVLFSIPFGQRESRERVNSNEDDFNSLFVFHVLGTLQFKKFPSVFSSSTEGRRFLLTGSEDENFNSLLVKLTFHPTHHLAIETKLNRFSNEFSSQPGVFTRYLIYGGVRYSF